MMTRLSTIFPSSKLLSSSLSKIKSEAASKNSPSKTIPEPKSKSKSKSKSNPKSWSVYLIISTNNPIKTYVGVTTDFSRRLRQHNGELKGGAKASCSGRPWICACLIHGFKDHSEACAFESKWKIFSRSLPRKRKDDNKVDQLNDLSHPLLQHRQAALNRVKGILDCSHLEIDWKLDGL